MKKGSLYLKSKADGLKIWTTVIMPSRKKPRGIVQFLHGMAECQAYYYDVMAKLADEEGMICVIHDHRGHGKSVREVDDLGYFYETDARAIVDDACQVSIYARRKFPHLPLFMVAYSMGTLVARKYLQKYDRALDGLVLIGAPYKNALAKPGIKLAGAITKLGGERKRSKFLGRLTLPSEPPKKWLSTNEEYLRDFSEDAECGFLYTASGYKEIARLSADAFCKKGWVMKNPQLPILMLAGQQDPIIGGEKRWLESARFLEERGYACVDRKLYPRLKHAILMDAPEQVVGDIAIFLDGIV